MDHEQYDQQYKADTFEVLTWLAAAVFCLVFWGAIIGLALRSLQPDV